jgi:chemotaxis signal transduction protein
MNTLQSAKGGFHTPLQQLLLLEERARQAGVRLPDADQERGFHGIKCVINGRDCVINLREVAEVIDSRPVTPIPGTATWIEGVINYRGSLVPVYRPHDFLDAGTDAEAALAREEGHLVVLRKDRKGSEFNAIRVNRMFGMQKFRDSDLKPAAQEAAAMGELDHYVDSCISSEGRTWQRINIARLMEQMCGTSPRQQ